MHILIDAHNLLHQDKDLKHLFRIDYLKAFQKLIDFISLYANANIKKKITVIFDGFAPEIYPVFQNLYIEESGTHQSADDVIKHYLSTSVNPKILKVITSDRELIAFAKNQGSDFFRSEEFIHELRFLDANPIEKEEEEAFNKIRKQKREDSLLDVFTSNSISEQELDDMHLNLTKEDREKVLNPKKKKKIKPKHNEEIDINQLKNHFEVTIEKSPNQKKAKSQNQSTYDKFDEINSKFSEIDFKELEDLFKK
jgi:predicted RNA-binding protein with PIN domain